jgi:hypothetical protein
VSGEPLEDRRIPMPDDVGVGYMDAAVWQARRLGLSDVVFVVRDAAPGPWLPAVLAEARRLRGLGRPRIGVALEVRVTGEDGRLSLAGTPPGVDGLYLTLDALPLDGCAGTPLELREAIGEGRVSAAEIVARSMQLLERALERHRGLVLTRPFALLRHTGIPEAWIGAGPLERLASVAAASGASLQVDEATRSPGLKVALAFARAGVPVVAGSGAADVHEVGAFEYLTGVARRLRQEAAPLRPLVRS